MLLLLSWRYFFPSLYVSANHDIIHFTCRFESLYIDDEIRVVKDIRQDYLVVERAPYSWKE